VYGVGKQAASKEPGKCSGQGDRHRTRLPCYRATSGRVSLRGSGSTNTFRLHTGSRQRIHERPLLLRVLVVSRLQRAAVTSKPEPPHGCKERSRSASACRAEECLQFTVDQLRFNSNRGSDIMSSKRVAGVTCGSGGGVQLYFLLRLLCTKYCEATAEVGEYILPVRSAESGE
jgi:hypothetical protein